MNLTANIIGATGLVGSYLTQLVLEDDRFSKVRVLTRRTTGIKHPKLEEHIIDFSDFDSWMHLITGDVHFSALGTTLKKAGRKSVQYRIDYHYQHNAAYAAKKNGITTCVLVSAPGAKPNSSVFYNRMKGNLDRDVKKLNFDHLHIIKPGLLTGRKDENRPAEKLGAVLLSFITWIPGLKQFRPIHGEIVAKAMLNASFLEASYSEHSLDEVFTLAEAD